MNEDPLLHSRNVKIFKQEQLTIFEPPSYMVQFGCGLLVLTLFVVTASILGAWLYLYLYILEHWADAAKIMTIYATVVLGITFVLPWIAFFEASHFLRWLKGR